MDTLRAEVLEWTTQPKADSGWLVAKMMDANGEAIVVTGCGLPRPGSWVELSGNYETHPRFGAQFKVRTVVNARPPLSSDGVARWLRDRVDGVGAKTAERLLKLFGGAHELWAAVERGSDVLMKAGVKPALAQSLAHAYETEGQDARYQAMLNGWGMTQNQVMKVKKHWPLNEASQLLSANPYLLADHIDGFGFLRADKVALASGLAPDAPVRCDAAVLYQLAQAAGEGHVFGDVFTFMRMARAVGLGMPKLIGAAIRMDKAGRLIVDKHPDRDRVYLPALHTAECAVADELKRRFVDAPTEPAPPITGLPAELTADQAAAVAQICDPSRTIVLVSGGPGTGKTTILRAALDELDARGVTTRLAAPTGKAARRMVSATGRAASTLHRMLGYRPAAGVADCEHCRRESAEFDYSGGAADSADGLARCIIVDESSMVDVELMAALMVKARGDKLVFVGDHNQLPPVGPGQPFQDALSVAPDSCQAVLTHVHRSKGEWVKLAAPMILRGEYPPLDPDVGFRFIETPLADGVVSTLHALFAGELDDEHMRFDVDVRGACDGNLPVVLSPQRKSAAGVTALNLYLHDHQNPAEPDDLAVELEDGTCIRMASWVMFTKNDPRMGVCNGDTGRVIEVVPAARDPRKVASLVIAVDADTEDAKPVDVPIGKARDLRLAYASTIHKAQGMEYPWVICVVHSAHHRMLTRRLLYTAVTRAKLGVIIIGDRAGLKGAIDNAREVPRNTVLRERITMNDEGREGLSDV